MAKLSLRLTLSEGAWPEDTGSSIVTSFSNNEVTLPARPAFSLDSLDPAALHLMLDVAKVVALPILSELIKYLLAHLKKAKPNPTATIRIKTGNTAISVPVGASPEQIEATARTLATALQGDGKGHGSVS